MLGFSRLCLCSAAESDRHESVVSIDGHRMEHLPSWRTHKYKYQVAAARRETLLCAKVLVLVLK
jgi:hypothetical protein